MRSFFAPAGLILGMLLLVVISLPPTEDSILLTFTGDIMLGRGVAQAHSNGNWDQALAFLVPYTSSADLTFANLESPLTNAPLIRSTYDLRAPPQAVRALTSSGFRVVSMANNHAFDSGVQGVQDTIRALQSEGIMPIGMDQGTWITQLKGMKVAWVALDDVLMPLKETEVEHRVVEACQQADLVVVSIHWGSEGASAPNNRQRSLAQLFANAGADIIIGHHPHVLQPTEWIWGTGRNRPTLITFSLGNALFDQVAPPSTRYGALLRITAYHLGVQSACVVPFQIDPRTRNIKLASPSTAKVVLQAIQLELCQEELMKEDPKTSQ